MGTLVIRDLDDAVEQRLRDRATSRGRSVEEEARSILGQAVPQGVSGRQLLEYFDRAFGPEGGIDLEIPEMGSWEPPVFEP